MRLAIFAHSWLSDWNHGNAHFLRGLARALIARGHQVQAFEGQPGNWGAWSLAQLFAEEPVVALSAIQDFRRHYPELRPEFYPCARRWPEIAEDWLSRRLRETAVVLLHEWNEPELGEVLARLRRRMGFQLFLLDTHHRGYSQPEAIARFPLREFDAVLAFGESLRQLYLTRFGVCRAYCFHEAADETVFRPLAPAAEPRAEVVWIGNWGDEERTRQIREFLLLPASHLPQYRFLAHGVRYPDWARGEMDRSGIRYAGYLPNLRAVEVYGAACASVHIPRQTYANGLSGIPTIRVFEALACGIALVSSPWEDREGLFQAGRDYWMARDGAEMTAMLAELLRDDRCRVELARQGRETVLQRHTCRHRAQQLEALCAA